jgi:hypothetical protein
MHSNLLRLTLAFSFGFALTFTLEACSPNNPPVCSGQCTCSSSSCTCATGATCVLGDVDAGTGAASQPSNVAYDCQSNNTCTVACGTGCSTTCLGGSTCNQTLGAGATVTCGGGSKCDTKAGADAGVSCTGTSTCEANVGANSTIVCDGTALCKVECPAGGCTVLCQGDAVCTCDPKDSGKPCTMTCSGSSKAKQCGDKTACVKPTGDCP